MTDPELPRILVPRVTEHPSGLWVPTDVSVGAPLPEIPEGMLIVVGQPPSDLDVIGAAPDPEALGIPRVSLSTVDEILASLPFEPAMMALSVISAAALFAGADQSKHLRLAEDVFGTGRPIFHKARDFLSESPSHVIFNEQHLSVLMRMLIAGSASSDEGLRELTDEEVDSLLMALVGIGSPVAEASDSIGDPNDPMSWVPYWVRSGLYFDKSNLGSDQGRAHALFVDLFVEADPQGHNWCDLGQWMAEDLASFQEQLAFGYAMGAWTKALDEDAPLVDRKVTVVTDGLLADQLPPATSNRLVGAISATRSELAERFAAAGESLDHLIWDRAPFEQRPFLRLSDGRLALMSPRFLHAWMGEGFYYRLLDSSGARQLPTDPSQSMSRRFTEFHGKLVEGYLLEITEDSHRDQRRAGLATVSGEQTYQGPDGTESLSPDITVALGTDLVAIEVTGGRPARRARVLSDPEVMLEAIGRVIGKMSELDSAIRDILDRRVSIEGTDLDLLERIWPVVVVPSTVLQSELLWDHVDAEAPNLFNDPRLRPATLFSIEDYEHALGVVEQGRGLPWLLGARLDSLFRTMPPSHFFHQQRLEVDRPRYLDRHMRDAGDEAQHVLFGRQG